MHVLFRYLSIIKANKKLTCRVVIGNNLQIHNKFKYIPKSHLWLIQKTVTELFDDEIIQFSVIKIKINILCEILWFKTKKIQFHKGFDNVVKWILHMFDKYVASPSGEYFMSIFGHIFRYKCLLNTLPFNFYHHIFHLSHFLTCP